MIAVGKEFQTLGPSKRSMWAIIRGGSGIVIMKIIISGEEMNPLKVSL